MPDGFPKIDFAMIDCADKTEVRGETGKQGVFYMALGVYGLWKFRYGAGNEASANEIAAVRLSRGVLYGEPV